MQSFSHVVSNPFFVILRKFITVAPETEPAERVNIATLPIALVYESDELSVKISSAGGRCFLLRVITIDHLARHDRTLS